MVLTAICKKANLSLPGSDILENYEHDKSSHNYIYVALLDQTVASDSMVYISVRHFFIKGHNFCDSVCFTGRRRLFKMGQLLQERHIIARKGYLHR